MVYFYIIDKDEVHDNQCSKSLQGWPMVTIFLKLHCFVALWWRITNNDNNNNNNNNKKKKKKKKNKNKSQII